MVLHAEAIKTAIEAHRRNMPYCMGTLYWQMNDCWPAASWSGIDYYGRWKAMHYFVKKAYEPVIVSAVEESGGLNFYIVSEKAEPLAGKLKIRFTDINGKTRSEKETELIVPPGSSSVYYAEDMAALRASDKKIALAQAVFEADGGGSASNLFYLDKIKDVKLPKAKVKYTLEQTASGWTARLKTNKLAKNVYLRLEGVLNFSDNFFDLLPGEPKEVTFESELPLKEIKKQLKITTLNEVYGK
jgi:beta-mannosidase